MNHTKHLYEKFQFVALNYLAKHGNYMDYNWKAESIRETCSCRLFSHKKKEERAKGVQAFIYKRVS